MTPSTDPGRARAAEALGLNADADGPKARAAFLRRLADGGFVPPEEEVAAVNALAGTDLPLTPYTRANAAAALRADVEAFAAEFWSLPPEVRLERWAALSDRNPDCRTEARLAHLARGLDIEVRTHEDLAVEGLTRIIRDLFILTNRERAVRRARWLADRAGPLSHQEWDKLREHDPATAALDPVLLELIDLASEVHPAPSSEARSDANNRRRVGEVPPSRRKWNPSPNEYSGRSSEEIPPARRRWNLPPNEYSGRLFQEVPPARTIERDFDEPNSAEPKTRRRQLNWGQSEGTKWVTIVVIVLSIGVVRGLLTLTKQTSTSPTGVSTQFNRPVRSFSTAPDFRWKPKTAEEYFTREELDAIRQYELKKEGDPPPRYIEWYLRKSAERGESRTPTRSDLPPQRR